MVDTTTGGLWEEGLDALSHGNTARALVCFEELVTEERLPAYLSPLAFCLARERGEYRKAISLCKEAVRHEPKNTVHFLYLGRVHLLAGEKKDAVRIFRMGLRHGRDMAIQGELNRLGIRKAPVFPFLKRENPINKYAGKLFAKIGLR